MNQQTRVHIVHRRALWIVDRTPEILPIYMYHRSKDSREQGTIASHRIVSYRRVGIYIDNRVNRLWKRIFFPAREILARETATWCDFKGRKTRVVVIWPAASLMIRLCMKDKVLDYTPYGVIFHYISANRKFTANFSIPFRLAMIFRSFDTDTV